ncbi:hypothetical protein [Microbulbifer sp. 2205BS26-8]|uniref:hypothetical protein n=1 Tax=Microbulbifer sp. 2205BS26-8 TaxID=3064386 RepID=UPI00273F9FDB|nr:hypothetical protein [Microbulbifer sp. 2205BS26-8]MDP5211308.1 hypothetical protein [Microbulbifer sp. 2205BS26-8]
MQGGLSTKAASVTLSIILPLFALAQEQQYTPAEDLTLPKIIVVHGKIATPILTSDKNSVPEHLQEFGLYRTGLYADDEDISTVASFATFVDVRHNNIDQILIARMQGLKLWVDVRRVFFTKESGNWIKRQDYLEHWKAAKDNLKLFENIIYAFDPLDEPFWNTRETMPEEALSNYLIDIGHILKKDFPNAKRAVTFTAWTLGKSWFSQNIPGNYNLFGADDYRGIDFSSTVVRDLMDKTEHLDAKYYLIPQAFWTNDSTFAAYLSQEQLISKARQAYNFAISHPDVQVLRPYHWDSYEYDQYIFKGVEDQNKLRKEYEKIGIAISKFR